MQHAGQLVSRAELTKALWPNTVVEDNNLNVAISTLRRALGDEAPGQRYVVTVAGRGYQLVADVREVARANGDEPVSAQRHPPPPAAGAPTAGYRGHSQLECSLAVGRSGERVGKKSRCDRDSGRHPVLGGRRRSQRGTCCDHRLGSASLVRHVVSGQRVVPVVGTRRRARRVRLGRRRRQLLDVYVTRLGAYDPLRLTTDDAADLGPAWSPDGRQIAFFRQRDLLHGDIYVVPALGGPERKVLEVSSNFMIGGMFAPLLAWTPDGEHLVFTGQTDDVGDIASGFDFYLLSLETGAVRALPIAGDGFDVGPAFAPDGKRLAFTRYDAVMRDGEVMVQELDAGFVPRGAPQLVPDSSLQYPASRFGRRMAHAWPSLGRRKCSSGRWVATFVRSIKQPRGRSAGFPWCGEAEIGPSRSPRAASRTSTSGCCRSIP